MSSLYLMEIKELYITETLNVNMDLLGKVL